MRSPRLLLLASALLAMLAVAASADTINTYNFTATTEPYYQYSGCCSATLISPSITITGTFTYDATNLTMTAWSFDFSPLVGYQEQGLGSSSTTIDPIDVNGSYDLNNTNSYFNSQDSTEVFTIDAYSGDGSYYSNITVDANVGSGLEFEFSNPLPTAAGVTDTLLGSPFTGDYTQCQGNCNGESNYNVYFASGSAIIPTPEPPSWALMGAGALLLGGVMLWSDRRRALIY